ncbi:glycosyltransferase family 2 protein [Roseospira visakhapatnamensis]|uniref:GT2 family glycosyltransferase n=1 Tax=Roseospira visakhapatnamensis TaxID=390880 RepID=A0A7W6W9S4_9PROT|nr:glycosyltransferase family 2 protein [Roseospira visakhapatnamensis]MBB4266435.1 GT2 family glycosyltransferase [Roseospira visakhapatnamensis]
MTTTPWVRVVVVTMTEGPLLGRCLGALLAQTDPAFEVVVVANGADPAILDPVLPDDPRVHVLRLPTNIGYSAANNVGANHETGRPPPAFIATLNPDAFPDPDWLVALKTAVRRHSEASAFASLQVLDRAPALCDGLGDEMAPVCLVWRGGIRHPVPPRDRLVEGPCFSACAAAALYRRAAWDTVGGFDGAFFCYLDDVDLCFRLRLRGGSVVFVPGARVHHVGSATNGEDSDFIRFHTARNRLWLYVKAMPGPLFWGMLPAFVATGLLLLARGMARGRGRIEVRGLVAGLAGLPRVWRQRRAVQRARTAPWWRLAAAMTWDPRRFLARAPRRDRIRPP